MRGRGRPWRPLSQMPPKYRRRVIASASQVLLTWPVNIMTA
ncbi:hypothetical protein ASAC_0397 [Acidilobus saccharovorans 345-15]|uniref:Uncharacterized protein n=1 Tax=Acidilobus saccharovorans (strain DSM 16705 / JCM 18335 / VKM B-2471 / 345-15) TaxID=666510 RepID=D9Q0G6_ACIS3|nr:hypothetical protein ASAC_0397 [Acidilobus saccharovorans 345-15]